MVLRPVEVSHSCKKSLSNFKNGASTTLSRFVACNVNSLSAAYIISTQAERCQERKKAHSPNSKIHSKNTLPVSQKLAQLMIDIHYRFMCTWIHIRTCPHSTHYKKYRNFFILIIIISLIYLSFCKFLIENILLNFPFSLEHACQRTIALPIPRILP